METQAKFAPGEIQTILLHHLGNGACKTIDQLDDELSLNRRQISDGARKLIIRGLLERIELGCYQLTEDGLDAAMLATKITSGPQSKDVCKVRKPFSDTIRQRAWRTMRMGSTFTIPSLTVATAKPNDKRPENNLQRYVRALVAARYVMQLPISEKGTRPGSNGFKRYRLVKNTGPHAPTIRRDRKTLVDRNLDDGEGGEVPCQ